MFMTRGMIRGKRTSFPSALAMTTTNLIARGDHKMHSL